MKEFHIISSGVSLLTNARSAGKIDNNIRISDEVYWEKFLDDSHRLLELYAFLTENPQQNSAELNTFLRVVQNKDPKNIEVYLFGTKTSSNEICRRLIERYLRDKGFIIYTPFEVSGYFWEAQFDESLAVDEFKKGISDLLDRLISLAQKKRKEGYQVYFNPTGGLKAHVITTAIASFLTDCEMYYMNEEFNEVVFIPLHFYLPKGREKQLLKKLSSKMVISGNACKKLCSEYENEVDRLQIYGLIHLDLNEQNKPYRIRITPKAKLFLK